LNPWIPLPIQMEPVHFSRFLKDNITSLAYLFS
jgi:hypothetical protein